MEKDLKIIFHIEGIEGFTPCCTIFYTKKKTLYNIDVLILPSILNSSQCFTVYSYLEKNYNYMVTLLLDNDEKTTFEIIEDVFKNKDYSFKSSKNKLMTILRKDKIHNLLS